MSLRHTRLLTYVDEIARLGSIRKAAEQLNITPSALNRRIQDLEEELDTPIFERLPRGVRLNAAGELFIRHVRAQLADLSRVRSQISDLSGLRRGTVTIACSQALAYHLLPTRIAAYRERFPLVSFTVHVVDHNEALVALADYAVDLVLVFRPQNTTDFQVLSRVEQRLFAVMSADHPLASEKILRLRDCLDYPLALAERAYGGRQLLDEALGRNALRAAPVIESNSFEFLRNYVRFERAITFQIQVGTPNDLRERHGLIAKAIDPRDIRPAALIMAQLRGRALSVAAAKFADELARYLETEALTSIWEP